MGARGRNFRGRSFAGALGLISLPDNQASSLFNGAEAEPCAPIYRPAFPAMKKISHPAYLADCR